MLETKVKEKCMLVVGVGEHCASVSARREAGGGGRIKGLGEKGGFRMREMREDGNAGTHANLKHGKEVSGTNILQETQGSREWAMKTFEQRISESDRKLLSKRGFFGGCSVPT